MECLKRRDEEPDRCSPVRIAAETGMLPATALEVIAGCLDRNETECRGD